MRDDHVEDRSLVHRIARSIRWSSVPIVLVWLLIAVITNVYVPQLEEVGKAHNVGLSSPDAPSLQAMKRIGKVFGEFDSDSAAMIVLEGQQAPRRRRAPLLRHLGPQTQRRHHACAAHSGLLGGSADGGGLAEQGRQGRLRHRCFWPAIRARHYRCKSVDSVRDIVDHTPPPPGVKAYVTGAAPLFSRPDLGRQQRYREGHPHHHRGHHRPCCSSSTDRSSATVLVLLTVLIELTAARGVVAMLANFGIIGLSTYSTNLLTLLAIAAGTDYAIFLVGRYHEARQAGEDRETAYLHHVPRHRACDRRLGADGRRRGVLPELHPAALLPDPGPTRARSACW